MKRILLIASLLIIVFAMSASADPVLSSIGSKTVDEGAQLTFSVAATAADNGSNEFMLDSQAPVSGVSSADIGGNTAELARTSNTGASFTWTAPFITADTDYTVNISVSDGNSTSYEIVQITVLNTGANLAISDLNIGGDNQVRSNPEAEDEEDEEVYDDSSTFTITNNGGSSISDVQVNWPSASKYNITYVSSSKTGVETSNGVRFANINSGETISVVVSARIPEDLDAFDNDRTNAQDNRNFKIGELSLTASGQSPQNSNVYMQAENMLEIEDLEICVDGDCDDYDDGDEVEEIEPGSEIEIRINAENLFQDEANLEIEDVEFRFFADDGDLDEEEDEDMGDIDTEEEESGTLSLTLDDDIDEDDYRIEITLFGEDENGAEHGEQWDLDFVVEREDEMISIRTADVDDQTISLCPNANRQTQLEMRIENEGSDDSDEIVLVAKNDLLGFFYRSLEIDLDTDDDVTKTATITVPSDASPGTYQIDIYTYFDLDAYDDEDINNYRSVDLRVEECEQEEEQEEQEEQEENESEDEEVVVIEEPPQQPQQPQQPGDGAVAVPVESVSGEEDGVDTYFALIILAYIVVILIAIFLIAKLIRGK